MGLDAGRDTNQFSKFYLGRYISKALAFRVVADVKYERFGAKLDSHFSLVDDFPLGIFERDRKENINLPRLYHYLAVVLSSPCKLQFRGLDSLRIGAKEYIYIFRNRRHVKGHVSRQTLQGFL